MGNNVLKNRQSVISIFVFFYVLFVVSTALGQQPDSAMPQSQADKIIEKIDQLEKNMLKRMHDLETKIGKQLHDLELKMRDHVDTKFKELDTRIDKLNDRIDKLNEDVSFIKGQLTIIKWGIAIFGAPLLIGLIIYFLQNRTQRANVTEDSQNTI